MDNLDQSMEMSLHEEGNLGMGWSDNLESIEGGVWGGEPWDDDEEAEPVPSSVHYGRGKNDRLHSLSDPQQNWTNFSGEKVGWKFHDKPHFLRGIYVDGWQEMENDDEGISNK